MSSAGHNIEAYLQLDLSTWESSITNVSKDLTKLQKTFQELGSGSATNLEKVFTNLQGKVKDTSSSISSLKDDFTTLTGSFNSMGLDFSAITDKIANSTSRIGAEFNQWTPAISGVNSQLVAIDESLSKMNSKAGLTADEYIKQQTALREEVQAANELKSALDWVNEGFIENEAAINREEQALIHEQTALDYLNNQLMEKLALEERSIMQIQQQANSLSFITSELSTHIALEKEAEELLNLQIESSSRLSTYVIEQTGLSQRKLATLEEELAIESELQAMYGIGSTKLEQKLALTEEIRSLEALVTEQYIAEDDAILLTVTELSKKAAELERCLALENEMIAATEREAVAQEKSATASRTQGTQRENKLNAIGRRTVSMFATMLAFNEAMDVFDKTVEHTTASQNIQYFGQRLNMNQQEIKSYTDSLNDMQKTFKTIDMTQVGGYVTEAAVKYKLGKDSLVDLTKTYAVATSAFKKEGRTQQDAILAVNDALDGQFKRMNEIGITKDRLKLYGWNGDLQDTASLLQAINAAMKDMGYEQSAKDIKNSAEAWEYFKIRLASALSELWKVADPAILAALQFLCAALDALVWAGEKVYNALNKIIPDDWKQPIATVAGGIMLGVAALIAFWKVAKTLKGITGLFGKIFGKADDIKKTGDEIDKVKTKMEDLGKSSDNMSMKDRFKTGFGEGVKGLGKNIGKIVKAVGTAVVAIAGAFIILEEIIVGFYAVTWTFARLGELYAKEEENLNSGTEALRFFMETLRKNVDLIVIALSLVIGSQFTTVSKLTKGFKKGAIAIAEAFAIMAEIIAVMIAPMLALGALGYIKDWLGTNVDNGLEAIDTVGQVIDKFSQHILAFAIIIGNGLIISKVKSAFVTELLAIGAGMTMFAAAIASLAIPLAGLAALGWIRDKLNGDNINNGLQAVADIGTIFTNIANVIGQFATTIPIIINALNTIKNSLGMDGGLGSITGAVSGVIDTGSLILQLSMLKIEIDAIANFANSLSGMAFDGASITTVASNISMTATSIPIIKQAIDNIKSALGVSDDIGANVGNMVNGKVQEATGQTLDDKLQLLKENAKKIIDFARGFNTDFEGVDGDIISNVSNSITALQEAVNTFIASVDGMSSQLKDSGYNFAGAFNSGLREGSAYTAQAAQTLIDNTVNTINNGKGKVKNAGNNLGKEVAEGFKTGVNPMSQYMQNEINETIRVIEDNAPRLRSAGNSAGSNAANTYRSNNFFSSLRGSVSSNVNSAVQTVFSSVSNMYSAGAALGGALTGGYNSNSNLKTNIAMLRGSSVSGNEVSQYGSKSNKKSNRNGSSGGGDKITNLNLDLRGTSFYGVDEFKQIVREIAQDEFININSINLNTGL